MSGHVFVRPGQVAPHPPPPDNCMVCGQPEAAHVTAELQARRTAAAAVAADFDREIDAYLDRPAGTAGPDYSTWAVRMRAELRSLLEDEKPDPAAGQRRRQRRPGRPEASSRGAAN